MFLSMCLANPGTESTDATVLSRIRLISSPVQHVIVADL